MPFPHCLSVLLWKAVLDRMEGGKNVGSSTWNSWQCSKLTHQAQAQMWPAFRNCTLMKIVRRHYRMRIITPPQVLWIF